MTGNLPYARGLPYKKSEKLHREYGNLTIWGRGYILQEAFDTLPQGKYRNLP